ncbi:unnamed protein product [Brassica napus]|uniref:(rape) hypothetical protein n=1 Tax=Brassica napus TaxID=3708 RepID=A0A816IKB3_BRANA|nr:unnamed protein product [Brassica napus]
MVFFLPGDFQRRIREGGHARVLCNRRFGMYCCEITGVDAKMKDGVLKVLITPRPNTTTNE